MARSERRYWMSMNYECDKCGHGMLFYLEDGCEGPCNGGEEIHVVKDGPYRGQRMPWPKTASGRFVLPVPFVAGGCPKCQPSKPWRPTGGVLQHNHYNLDRKFPELMVGEAEALLFGALFRYPDDPLADQACGVPVFPGEVGARS